MLSNAKRASKIGRTEDKSTSILRLNCVMKYLIPFGIALLCASVASAVEIRRVAFSGDAAPIATPAVTVLLLDGLSGPVISDQGHIAFVAAIYEKFPFSPARVKGGLSGIRSVKDWHLSPATGGRSDGRAFAEIHGVSLAGNCH